MVQVVDLCTVIFRASQTNCSSSPEICTLPIQCSRLNNCKSNEKAWLGLPIFSIGLLKPITTVS